MHYYKRNIGDYYKKAGRLSILQHGAYTVLIDACYDREKFPTKEEALEWTWASTEEEIKAVEFILSRFFALEDGVYVQQRIEEEVNNYHKNAATNKRIAQEREAKRKASSTKRERKVNEAPPNHKPRTTNQEPDYIIPDGINLDSWKEWESFRKDKKKKISKQAAAKQFKLLLKYSKDQQALIINQSIQNDYQGLFDLKGGNNEKNTTNGPKQDNSLQARVAEEARKARENNKSMGDYDRDLSKQMDIEEWGEDRRQKNMGSVLEGDFRRTD